VGWQGCHSAPGTSRAPGERCWSVGQGCAACLVTSFLQAVQDEGWWMEVPFGSCGFGAEGVQKKNRGEMGACVA